MKKFLMLFLVLFVFPLFVNAEQPAFKITCPLGGAINSEISCKIEINSDVKIKEVSANYDFDSNFNFVSLIAGTGFDITSSNKNGFAIKSTGVDGSISLATLKLKFLKEGNLILNNIKLTDIDDNVYSADSIEQLVSAYSTDNTLKSITLSTGTLDPEFNPDITSYKVEVSTDTITINLEPNNSKAVLKKTITQKLKVGVNNIKIEVKSEAGTKKTYTLAITRLGNEISSSVKSISLSAGKLDFDSNMKSYVVSIPSSTSEVKINAELLNATASFVEGFGPRTVELVSDEVTALLKVKNVNESIETYTLTFIKTGSSNTDIKELFINDYKVNLEKDVYKYEARVKEKSNLEFKVVLEDEKSKYEIVDNSEDNDIVIRVTAENGDFKDYIFTIIEEEKVTFFSDFVCSNNSLIYYIIVFLLGAILSLIICSLIYSKKMQKIEKKIPDKKTEQVSKVGAYPNNQVNPNQNNVNPNQNGYRNVYNNQYGYQNYNNPNNYNNNQK